MFITLFNNHAITNRILIIVLEGTLRHKQTHKNNSFWVFKTNFSNFYVIFGFLLQNTLKHIKTAQKQLKTARNKSSSNG